MEKNLTAQEIVIGLYEADGCHTVVDFVKENDLPEKLLVMLGRAYKSPEHPIYHPELTLHKHIDIVTRRCKQLAKEEMVFVGILHDICKHGFCDFITTEKRIGEMKVLDEGVYWQNVHHAEQAVKFIRLPEIYTWLESKKLDIQFIEKLVGSHMTMKNYLSGEFGKKGGMGVKNVKNSAANFLTKHGIFL